MNRTLFKLTAPITRATVNDFEADHGFKPTKEADLRAFGYAWGAVEPAPVASGGVVELAEPVLSGQFVTQGWTERERTVQEIADEQSGFSDGVTAERDRRLTEGTTVTVTGYGDIPLQGRSNDQINLIALSDTARDLIAAGVDSAVIPFRDALNAMHMLTPAQTKEMADKGKAAASAFYAAAWTLKDNTPIPSDFTDDKWWP